MIAFAWSYVALGAWAFGFIGAVVAAFDRPHPSYRWLFKIWLSAIWPITLCFQLGYVTVAGHFSKGDFGEPHD